MSGGYPFSPPDRTPRTLANLSCEWYPERAFPSWPPPPPARILASDKYGSSPWHFVCSCGACNRSDAA